MVVIKKQKQTIYIHLQLRYYHTISVLMVQVSL